MVFGVSPNVRVVESNVTVGVADKGAVPEGWGVSNDCTGYYSEYYHS